MPNLRVNRDIFAGHILGTARELGARLAATGQDVELAVELIQA